jgi:hypothetical protein
MAQRCALSIFVAVIFTAVGWVPFCDAQSVPALDKIQNQEELNKAITALDAALFDAYNKCDLQNSVISRRGVEFYHDQEASRRRGGACQREEEYLRAGHANWCLNARAHPRQDTGDRDGRAPVSSSGASGERGWGGKVCASVAVQGWGVEGDAGAELRPSCGGEVTHFS